MQEKFQISTEIKGVSGIVGEEKAIELIAKAGFDAWDFSMFSMCKDKTHPLSGDDCLKFARRLKQIGLDNGIVCNQSHAPFPAAKPEIRACFKRAIECTAEAGGKICIIHPDNNKGAEENAEMYLELLPFAKECGVKIATENMWSWDEKKENPVFAACATPESFCEHVDAVGDDWLVACLDIGHAEMKTLGTSAVEMIHALGARLQTIHLHDNDRFHDSHQIPFSMDIDYKPIANALKEIHYQGDITLEATKFLVGYTEENVSDGIKQLADAARKFAQMLL